MSAIDCLKEGMVDTREEVKRFSQMMELVLRDNDHKGGWNKMSFKELLSRLKEETQELEDAIVMKKIETKDCKLILTDIAKEATDIANFAMMIADNAIMLIEDGEI